MNVLMIFTDNPKDAEQLILPLNERIHQLKSLRHPYGTKKQKSRSDLYQNIVDFLTGLPGIHDNQSRWALLISAGLDDQLIDRISLGSSLTTFFQLLIPTLEYYGELKDGRNPLESLLEAAKKLVGSNKRKDCEQIISDLRNLEISQSLTPVDERDILKFRTIWAVNWKDIQKALLDFPSAILHFIGHSGVDGKPGIQFEDSLGSKKFVEPAILSEMLRTVAHQVTCVVFDVCYDPLQVEIIAQHLAYTIGIPLLLKDKISIEFMAAFYDALETGKSIEFAFNAGRNAIYMMGVSEDAVPILFRKHFERDSELERLSTAEQFYRAGLEYFKNTEFDNAQNVLARTLAIYPNHLDATLLLGRVHLAKQEPLQAIEIFERTYEDEPVKSQDFLLQALKAQIACCRDDSQRVHLYERIEKIHAQIQAQSLFDLQRQLDLQRQYFQGTALLEIELLNQQEDLLWQEELILKFRIKNKGNAPANNVRVELATHEAYQILNDTSVTVDFITPIYPCEITYRIHPLRHIFTLKISYAYTDVIEKQQFYEQHIQLLDTPKQQFERLDNPYHSGNLTQHIENGDTTMFYGRHETIEILRNILIDNDERLVIIYGQRRTGKSCLLKYLEKAGCFRPELSVAFVNVQGFSSDKELFQNLLVQLIRLIPSVQNMPHQCDSFDDFATFFNQCAECTERPIVMLFDEFEIVADERFEYHIFTDAQEFLRKFRSFAQYAPRLKFVLAGADEFRTMVNDYANPLFKAGRTFRIGALTPLEARALITEPVAERVTYTEQAIQAIHQATANHPYYVQLLCQTLMMILNQKKIETVTITEVNQAVEYIGKSGDGDFEYVWSITGKEAHLMLTVVAQEMNGTQWIPIERIEEILKTEHLHVPVELLDDAIQELVEKDVLAEQQATLEYTIPMGLLQAWIARYKPLKKLRRELKSC